MSENIKRMAEGWYGYGRWQAPYWFIGPEPGMATSEGDNLAARCAAWETLGAGEVIDCFQHHKAFGLMKWHLGTKPPTQSTWRQLIRLLLAYKALPTDNEEIRDYQRRHWGSQNGETCVIELSAVAANSLSTERADRLAFRNSRIDTIRERIDTFQPVFVVMYGTTNRENWEYLIGGKFDESGFNVRGKTVLCMAKHPVGGKPSEPDSYWINLGLELRHRAEQQRGAA